ASWAESRRTKVPLSWLATQRRWAGSNARPVGALSEPELVAITVVALLKPELVSSAGPNARTRLSSALVIHISPRESNATPTSVWSRALGVVSVVAGTRSPVPLSCAGARRTMAPGLALAVQRPSGTAGPGPGLGGVLDMVESEPQAATTESRRMTTARRDVRRIVSDFLEEGGGVAAPPGRARRLPVEVHHGVA